MPIEDTNRAIRLADARSQIISEDARLASVIHAIDDLMFKLEDLNLRGVDRVPSDLRKVAEHIISVVHPAPGVPLAPGVDDPIRVRFRVVPLMDVMFEVQDVVFQLRHPARIVEPEELPESA